MIKFSILTSIYKSEPHLESYFRTIFSQKLLPSEIILIDDTKNPQNIDEIIDEKKKLYNFRNIKIFKNQNNIGPARSLNKGLKNCNYDLIFRLDVDDEWKVNHTSKMIKLYKRNKNCLIYANSIRTQNLLTKIKCDKYFINENHLIHSSWLINRNIKKNFKYRMEVPSIALEDYFSILYYRSKGYQICFTDDKTTYYKYTQDSHGRLNLKNKKYMIVRKLISKHFFKFHLKSKTYTKKIKFILFDYGIIKLLVYLFWIQDYLYIKRLIR